jgi:hypothetical protein
VIRRFYERSPTKRTRYTTEFYYLVNQATEARRTMRTMLKSQEPDIAREIAVSQANREYQLLSTALKADRTMSAQQRIVQELGVVLSV